MEIQLQLILTAYFVNSGWTLVQSYNSIADQAFTSNMDDAGRVRENIENFYNFVAKSDVRKSEAYQKIVKQEIIKGQQTFNKMKEELWIAQHRKANKKRNLYQRSDADGADIMVKREINEKNPKEDIRAAFSELEKQLERVLDSQEKHYRQAYEQFGGVKNETVSTAEQSTKSTTLTNIANFGLYNHLAERDRVEALNEAMAALQNKAFEMLSNHAKIMGNEADIIKKVEEYEQNVDRVSEQIEKGHEEEVKELLMKKEQVLSEKGIPKNVTVQQKMSKFAEDRLLKSDPFHNTNKVQLRDAIARLKSRIERMMGTQLKVLENQSKFTAMVDKFNRQLIRAHGDVLRKRKESPSTTIIPTRITTQEPV